MKQPDWSECYSHGTIGGVLLASPGHSGHTATTTPFDLGVKDLLGNSFEDDDVFWAEFSK